MLGKWVYNIQKEEQNEYFCSSFCFKSDIWLNNNLGGYSFGETDDGHPGFRKPGADTVIPFKSGANCIFLYGVYSKIIVFENNVTNLWIISSVTTILPKVKVNDVSKEIKYKELITSDSGYGMSYAVISNLHKGDRIEVSVSHTSYATAIVY